MIDIGNHGRDYDRTYYAPRNGGAPTGPGGVGKTEGTKDVNGTGGGRSLTFGTISRKSNFSPLAPDLDPSLPLTPKERQKHYQSICDKLTAIRGTGTGNSVVFDLYALMALIQEVSQALRNVTRDLRKLENQVIFTNIKSQAAIQRKAAVTAAIVGGIMCAVQVAVSVAGTMKQLKSIRGAALAGKATGATADAKVANYNKVGSNVEAAGKNLAKLKKRMPGVDPKMKNYEQVLASKGGEPVSAKDMHRMEGDVKFWKEAKSKAQGELDYLKKHEPNATNKIDAAKAKVATADRNLTNAELTYKGAVKTHQELNAAALKDVEGYRDQLKVAGEHYTDVQQGYKEGKFTKADLKAAKAELDLAEKNYVMAGAKQAKISAELKLPEADYKDMSAQYDAQADASMAQCRNHPLSKDADVSAIHGQIMTQISQQVGQYLQQVVQSVKEIMNSRATELQAQQKVTEEQFDQIRDIFTQVQSVIMKAIEIFGAVTQKESQTVEEIMNNFKA